MASNAAAGILERREHLDVADQFPSAPQRAEWGGPRRRRPPVRQSITGCARLIARPSGTRGTAARKCGQRGSDGRLDSGIEVPGSLEPLPRRPQWRDPLHSSRRASYAAWPAGRSRRRPTRTAIASRRADRRRPTRGAPRPPRRTCGEAGSAATGLASGGGSASSGPRSASESMWRDRTRAAASANSAASGASPRMAATAPSSSSVWGRAAAVVAPDLSGAIANLSARLARAPPASAPPWFPSADSPRATPRCRPLSVDGPVALTNQQGGHVRARELVGVGVVHDDVAIARQRGCGAVAVVANGARQAYGAVLVRILQAGVDQDRRRVAVEPLFQIFLGDSWDRHGG